MGEGADILISNRIIAALTLGWWLFAKAIISFHSEDMPTGLTQLWHDGLGQVNGYALMSGEFSRTGSAKDFFAHVMFANIFQLMISFLYLFYNNILIHQLVADEFIRFLSEKKTLRVSSPVGMQRSTYTLSLPWSYAIPLMVSYIFLHWLVSQSVFIVQTSAYQTVSEYAAVMLQGLDFHP